MAKTPTARRLLQFRLGTDLQFLQQAFPLFANLFWSSADLNRNGTIRVASG
ncbi:hypothetical protein ABIB81_008805 [Bradyrhizobium sp. I1.7.5]